MKHLLTTLLLSVCLSLSAQQSPHIHVDQFGYLSGMNKVAVISNPQVGFNAAQSYIPGTLQVRNADDDSVVLEADASTWNNGQTHSQSGDQGWWFDFSSVTSAGSYYIHDLGNNANSAVFEIGDSVYRDVLKAAGRAFYYNRCNAEKLPEHAGANWTDGTSFNNPGQDFDCRDIASPNDASTARDLSGGWFDAGDYNKYVTFASSAVHDLLWAYQHHPHAFADDWDIPESGNGIPDILDEVKYELDWVLKMNDPTTGETLLKLGSPNYSVNTSTPPSVNTDARFYIGYCSSAAVAAAGMFAHAAEVFQEYATDFNNAALAEYATLLQNRAITTYNYANNYQTSNGWDLECDWGQVIAGDADYTTEEQNDWLLTAAVHLYSLTGDSNYNTYIVNNTPSTEQLVSYFWGVYKPDLNSALLHYTTLSNADATLSNDIISSFSGDVTNNGNGYYGLNDIDLYRSAMPDWSYHWGSNLPKANYGILNFLAAHYNVVDAAGSTDLLSKANEVVHYFHGLNPLSKVYLSNMYDQGGDNCVDELYHEWFKHNSIYDHVFNSPNGPAPGFLVGGPNDYYSGSSPQLGNNEPMQKAYADFNDVPSASWEITEPSISYQAAYVRLLAQFVDARSPATAIEPNLLVDGALAIFPNPSQDVLRITNNKTAIEIRIINATGQVVWTDFVDVDGKNIDLSNWQAGSYYIQALGKNKEVNQRLKFIKH